MTAADLEHLIECYRLMGTLEPDRARRQYAFDRMRELVGLRTPDRIAQMEAERGLRA